GREGRGGERSGRAKRARGGGKAVDGRGGRIDAEAHAMAAPAAIVQVNGDWAGCRSIRNRSCDAGITPGRGCLGAVKRYVSRTLGRSKVVASNRYRCTNRTGCRR